MKKAICKAILRMAGWRLGPTSGVELPKCVICVAPHTSNWDFIIGKLFYTSIGCDASFLIKKEWFFFPFNLLFNWLGGVPIDRGKQTSVTDQMAERFRASERFQLAITPEGTRKRVEEWKKGRASRPSSTRPAMPSGKSARFGRCTGALRPATRRTSRRYSARPLSSSLPAGREGGLPASGSEITKAWERDYQRLGARLPKRGSDIAT